MNPNEIKDYRTKKNLTQSELADICGSTKASVSRWEKGTNKPLGSSLKILNQLISGELIISQVTNLEAKLLDQNVEVSNYDNREDFLTASLKYLLLHGEFMPLDAPNISPQEQHPESHLRVAEDPHPYITERESNIIDPSTEENANGGDSNTSAS